VIKQIDCCVTVWIRTCDPWVHSSWT